MGALLTSVLFWQQVTSSQGYPRAVPAASQEQTEVQKKKPDPFLNKADTIVKENKEFFQGLAKKKTDRRLGFAPRGRDLFSNLQASIIARAQQTLLVIAPHPDDEILSSGSYMAQKLAEGWDIEVIYITDGDALDVCDFQAAQNYARTRRNESITAMEKLGVPKKHLRFLGFPDGALTDLYTKGVVTSPYTGQNKTSDISYFPLTPYTRDNLSTNLKKLIEEIHPQQIIIPAQHFDTHPDHQIVGRIVQDILDRDASVSPEVFVYIVHGNTCPEDAPRDQTKFGLIETFKSQMPTPRLRKFMEDFADRTEQFQKGRAISACGNGQVLVKK